jgi:hypothetical protein
VLALSLLLLGGCASPQPPQQWDGPLQPSLVQQRPWPKGPANSRIIVTPHYQLHTDMSDGDQLDMAAQLMEGAYQQYVTLAAGVPLSSPPMNSYLFAYRAQWAAFTQANTGPDASIYLQVNRGGYTLDDWFAVYWIGDVGTWSVMAHEGWHQFVARHFAGRLPPFLEEGTATLFEAVHWEGRLPRWNLADNPMRQHGLADALAAGRLWPLDELIRLHAGDIVALPTERVEAFYAENWAFARFLWEADGGRYRPGFQRLLADTAAGAAWLPPHYARPRLRAWDPKLVRPTLEHYLGESLDAIEPRFQGFMRKTASHRAAPVD